MTHVHGGWPKKDEEIRIYRDRDGSFLLVWAERDYRGLHDAVANVYTHPLPPSPVYTSVSPSYISERWLKRFQWDELPEVWKETFTQYMSNSDGEEGVEDFDPHKIRGFWRVRNAGYKRGAK